MTGLQWVQTISGKKYKSPELNATTLDSHSGGVMEGRVNLLASKLNIHLK